MDRIELLAPAKDLECGLAAINCGADAVYIGAQRFGARENAGNTLEDIGTLVRYAHKYWARVYVTVNTLLHNDEIPLAQRLIFQIHEIGADGVMIQDVGLLECDLPPIPLIASTQMHNNTPEKAAFLQEVGIRRVILARELSLTEIKAIRRAAPRIELECFVHGALCVSYSGQCYLSYALGGRSGNRGQCAQPCRKPYTLVDGSGRVIERKRHLLSLRDLNLSEYLEELIEVGVCSFKIEGRLRDKTYGSNVVAHYRARLDEILGRKGLRKSSSGTCKVGFVPDVEKTFNRGYTTHFLHGRSGDTGTPDTPKMVGTPAGKVIAVDGRRVILDADIPLYPGDGICFFNRNRELCGTFLKAVDGRAIVPNTIEGITEGMLVFRNHDQNFLARIKKSRPERRIAVALTLREIPDGFCLAAEDEDGNRAECSLHCVKEPADKPERALANIQKQIQRMGGTEFSCSSVEIALPRTYFLPISSVNALRRRVLESLAAVRAEQRPSQSGGVVRNDLPYPEKELSYLGNVLNRHADAFYRHHGVTRIEPAAESGPDLRGRKVMTTRYCLKYQLGFCPKAESKAQYSEPLFLIDEEGHRLELRFDCARCEMEIYLRDAIPAANDGISKMASPTSGT